MNFQPLKDFLDGYLPMLGIPGSDTSVYLGHEEIFRYQAGFDNNLIGTPVRADSLYNIYSCSKIATMVAAAQLIERGEISILDPVYAYIPEFRDITVKVKDANGNVVGERPAARPMLVKHLLSMTSGLNYDLYRPEVNDVVERTEGRAPTLEICRALAKAPLEFDPGTHFKYSLSHDVMAGVIEAVTGERFADYVKNNVFHPLGMYDTDYHPDPMKRHRFATHYSFDRVKGSEIIPFEQCRFRIGTEFDSGGAGVISSVGDYSLLMDALACGGVGKNGERILSSRTIDLMRTNLLTEEQITEFTERTSLTGYGYGWGVRTCIDKGIAGNLASLGQFGWDGWKLCYAFADPDCKLSLFHAEHMGGYHDVVIPRLRNLVYSCVF